MQINCAKYSLNTMDYNIIKYKHYDVMYMGRKFAENQRA